MIAKAIYSRLTGDATVSDLVGTRIYPHESPPSNRVYPLVVYAPTVGDDGDTYSGAGGLEKANVSFACIATSYADARELHDAVKAALDDRDGTWGGVAVQGAFLEGGTQDVETEDGTDRKFFIIESEYLFWYEKGA